MTDLSTMSATSLLTGYANKSISPVDVLKNALKRLEFHNPAINAFTHVAADSAMQQAKDSEARWMRGEPMGQADGMIATIKSNIAFKGWSARRGSTVVSDSPMTFDAPVVTALRQAGCVFIGQTTMPEFGWIGVTHSKLTGITRNPWNLSRTPGGSSGGAAAAGALGIGHFHIGTDGAGSIRIPCAFSGLFGIMPGVGRVPAYPASPFGVLARVGPMTRGVEDGALMLKILAKPDSRDIAATTFAAPDYPALLTKGLRGLRIGWSPRLGYVNQLDPAIEKACAQIAKRLTEFGAIVEEADPGFTHNQAYKPLRALWDAGCAQVVRDIPTIQQQDIDAGFLRCAALGKKRSATDILQALSDRAALHETMRQYHDRFDLLITPTMPTTAIEAGVEVPRDGSFGADWFNWSPYTWPFNITGQPAANVPIGLAPDGLPIGLQIVAAQGREDMVLRAAKGVEMLSQFPLLQSAVVGS